MFINKNFMISCSSISILVIGLFLIFSDVSWSGLTDTCLVAGDVKEWGEDENGAYFNFGNVLFCVDHMENSENCCSHEPGMIKVHYRFFVLIDAGEDTGTYEACTDWEEKTMTECFGEGNCLQNFYMSGWIAIPGGVETCAGKVQFYYTCSGHQDCHLFNANFPGKYYYDKMSIVNPCYGCISPTITATPTLSPTLTITPTATLTITATPTITPTLTMTPH